MPSQKDVKDVGADATVKQRARKFGARDFKYIAEYVIAERDRRRNNRKDLEKHWEEIDRQIAMVPDNSFKYIIDQNGTRKLDTNKAWMAEMELPLQAQALEVLNSDARRMMFGGEPWFEAHAEVTDEYLNNVDFQSIILGDENDVPTMINQDNADKLVHGFLMYQFRQMDFYNRYDRINAESFKYGMGVGRARRETKNVYIHEARGVMKERKRMPAIVPVGIKSLYLDDRPPSAHSSQMLGEAHILSEKIKFENLALAANAGSTDPDEEDGGWMPQGLKNLVPDENGYVEILEMEGDIVVPRKTSRSFVIPGAIVTVAVGGETAGVVRFRFRKDPFSSYVLHPYHHEHIDSVYPTSPLMKGRPVQIMATDALNRLMDSAMLKNAPPVGYDRNDMQFAQEGGPRIFPYAKWGTIDDIKIHKEVGGEPAQLSQMLSTAINLYAELTGILPSRLGAQTVSHTTAFAKDAELQRGATRTVDYVNSTGQGALNRWLDIAYTMGRDALKGDVTFFIDAYGGYVEVSKDQLPKKASFDWKGAGGPGEESARDAARSQSMQMALQMDQLNVQQGKAPVINIPSAIKEVLRVGKWKDIDVITNDEGAAGDGQAPSGPSGAIEADAGNVSTALQGIAFGGE